jgi:nicotinamidase-related amidase
MPPFGSSILSRIANASVKRMVPRNTAFFCVDVQERFRANIVAFDSVVAVSQRMAKTAQLLQLPLTLFGEQYPKGLGRVVPELQPFTSAPSAAAGDTVGLVKTLEKTSFSLWNDDARILLPKGHTIDTVVVCGIEAHVCVLQTVLDLVADGFCVHVLADGTSSQSNTDRFYAFERLKSTPNVFITTSQSVLMQLIVDAKHPKFKDISNLLKETMPSPQCTWV